MELHLDATESALLREVLDGVYRDLRYEISDTSTSTYKAALRERETAIRILLDRLGGPLPDPD
jgi:hypothetical protein